MLSLGIPCLLAICFVHYFMQKLYVGHYQTAKKLEYISYYDYLTDVYNRNVLGELIEPDTKQFIPSINKPISIMIFDIDFFKKVNDTYGHVKGDQVLKSLANTVKPMIGKKDYMLRWGGEEFVLILSGKGLDEASAFAEQVRMAVEASENGVCPITISIGVSAYDGKDYKSALDAADQALYRAKKNGRNRVET